MLVLITFIIFISIFFIPIYYTSDLSNSKFEFIDFIEDGNIIWPAPGYYTINSYFGKRKAPTSGASFYHKGIDIGAPEGSKYIAVTDGTITFVGFLGGGGYTVTLTDKNNNIKYSYCHSNPNFIVSEGEEVSKGQVIGYVGPKYVYGVKENRYYDSSGKPTNGATTGPHLHFGMRINNEYVNPLNYLLKK